MTIRCMPRTYSLILSWCRLHSQKFTNKRKIVTYEWPSWRNRARLLILGSFFYYALRCLSYNSKEFRFFRWWVWLRSSEAAWSHFTHSFGPVWSASLLHVRGFLESETNKQVVRSPAYGTKHMKTYRKDSGLLGFFNVSLFVWSICTFI